MDVSCPKVILVLLLAGLFCLPSTAASSDPENGWTASARGELAQAEPVELEFNNTTYSNSSLSFVIPSNSTIFSASVDLEGRPVVGPLQDNTLDFSGETANFAAYAGTYTQNVPGKGKPGVFSGSQLQGGELGKMAYQDGSYSEQYAYAYTGNYNYGYHHFKFKVPLDIVYNLSVTWVGYSGYYYSGWGGYGTSIAYLWNNITLTWETIGSASGGPKTCSKFFVNGTEYLDWSGYVHVLALTYAGWNYYSTAYTSIDTDYVKVSVKGNVLTYPKNPSMDIGANGRKEWKLDEAKFNYMVTASDSSLANEIQALVKNAPGHYTTIKTKFISDSIGKIRVTNLTVAYNAPPWCKGLPDTFRLEEDVPGPKLINLSKYFEDDQPNIRYEVSYEEDAKLLDAEINTDGHSLNFKLPTRNWWGRMGFRVRATDPEETPLSTESNTFTVTVDAVNDPPIINTISMQAAMQDKPFKFTVSAKDADCELDPTEKTTFSDNCSLFDINPSTGVIAFTPTQGQVGSYNVQVTATDRDGAVDRENFTLEVGDSEDPPVLDPIPDQTAIQDQPFSCKFVARDPDILYGDSLTFSDDSPIFQVNPVTGYLDFTPTVKDLGVRKVTITVIDKAGMSDHRSFNITVLNQIGNFDRPPAIQPIANQTVYDGNPLQIQLTASDPDTDKGDVLSFSDDCQLFVIDPATGKVDFTPARNDAGTYKVTLTVKDRDGLAVSTEFWLTVVKTNHPPVVLSVAPEDGTEITVGGKLSFAANATDPDGDELNYTWTDGATVLGYGPQAMLTFEEAATYLVTLTVSDGRLSVENETSVIVLVQQTGGGGVRQKKNPLPGFASLLAVGAIGVALVALAARRKP
jgi:hypothetical protein